MFEDISEIAENCAYLRAVSDDTALNLELWKKLPPYNQLKEFEAQLKSQKALQFHKVFDEPCGEYVLKCFLKANYSVDKAVFIKDTQLYALMKDESARLKIATLIYDRYLARQNEIYYNKGISVFDREDKKKRKKKPASHTNRTSEVTPADKEDRKNILMIGETNAIGVYGPNVKIVKEKIEQGQSPKNIFDDVSEEVVKDLVLDSFPRFLQSEFYQDYLRCKYYETIPVGPRDFSTFRLLGRGAFGAVNACRKNNSGKIYACKVIHKKQVQSQDSLSNIIQERDLLSVVQSKFVVNLKFATQDKDYLYLYLDLCLGGDLKFHLNNERRFSERKTKFYSAEVLLGLESMHQQNIIYRDMKPENILLDRKGHCRISDLGLAIQTKNPVHGYAGTPGYTAPEVCAHKPYGSASDLFGFGVMIFRFLTGKKPYGGARGSDLDENVMTIEPDYDQPEISPECADLLKGMLIKDPTKRLGAGPRGIQEIKDHPWFSDIDWGLLEAGCIDPPFVPSRDEIHADSVREIGQFNESKYKQVKLTMDFMEATKNFRYQSTLALQQELLEILLERDRERTFEKYSKKKIRKKKRNYDEEADECCTIL